ncbi:DUF6746 family protein [Pseudazoarcus pumilus]|uniref:Uncharacterized protein n=1 Tax=Pseudazoarcus pumilus TaxID=2067960 RepID=A0A2I6S959_9RHOO|nr:DUF6746 family protein [Pseudazoarcus pumilus]AUN95800.1 hypothetical protein C0099_13195 [Pseudazoarcus pumilus]
MKNILALTTVAIALTLSPAAFADEKVPERVAHYQGKQAADLDEALTLLRETNAELRELLAGKVGEYDMHDIHSLSYTLEEALADVREALAVAADDLESMHFYSEGLKRDEVIEYGNAYLDTVGRIVK